MCESSPGFNSFPVYQKKMGEPVFFFIILPYAILSSSHQKHCFEIYLLSPINEAYIIKREGNLDSPEAHSLTCGPQGQQC